MEQFFTELAENRHVVIPVLVGIAAGIIVFIFSLKLRKRLDAFMKSREDKRVASSSIVKAVRIESVTEMEMRGNPIYKYGRRYFAHYKYEVDGKTYKYHAISHTFPTETITLAYRGNPKKAVWVYEIPKPLWYRLSALLLWLSPFAAALLAVFLLGGAK